MFSLYAIYTMKMNNDNNAIYGFDVNLICEFFLIQNGKVREVLMLH